MEDVMGQQRNRELIEELSKAQNSEDFFKSAFHRASLPFNSPTPVNPDVFYDEKWMRSKLYEDFVNKRTEFSEELENGIDYKWRARSNTIGIEFISTKGLRVKNQIMRGELRLIDINFKL